MKKLVLPSNPDILYNTWLSSKKKNQVKTCQFNLLYSKKKTGPLPWEKIAHYPLPLPAYSPAGLLATKYFLTNWGGGKMSDPYPRGSAPSLLICWLAEIRCIFSYELLIILPMEGDIND